MNFFKIRKKKIKKIPQTTTNGTSVKRSRETYESCTISREERNALGRVALELVEQYGWSQEKVRELFCHASYSRAFQHSLRLAA